VRRVRSLRARASLAAGIAAIAALALAMPASAAITATQITTPTGTVYSTYNGDVPTNTFAISGTTDSTAPATDKVDLQCFYGNPAVRRTVATGVPLTAGGSFSVPAANLGNIVSSECRLRAVPAGTTVNSNVYRGPLMLTDGFATSKITGGPNAGTAYDFYAWGQQPTGAADYRSIGGGGLWDSYLVNEAYAIDVDVFFFNAALWYSNMDGLGDTRSEIQVGGQDAYDSTGAYGIFSRSGACPPTCDGSRDNAGFPPLTYTFSQDTTTGNVTIHESENLVRCPTAVTYPPTHATCGSFTGTGVKVDRTMVQDHGGHVTWITDSYSSTDGQAHPLDLLYENIQYLGGSKQPNIGYQFAGQSAYAAHVKGDNVTVPARPGSVYIKNLNADDGDPTTGQASITYSVAPTQNLFLSPANSGTSSFTMHYAGTVPASGALTYRFGYVTERTTEAVVADTLEVLHSFTPCVVPKLKGKTLSQAKAALKTAYCALGKVTKAKSKTVKKGRVISSKPAKGTKPFGTLVNLKVSKGKR
jgi:hypothetical protein